MLVGIGDDRYGVCGGEMTAKFFYVGCWASYFWRVDRGGNENLHNPFIVPCLVGFVNAGILQIMNILSISTDRKAFEAGSAVRSRFLDYGRLVDEFHVIVFTKKSLGLCEESFPPNIFLHPTNSYTSLGYIWGAIKQALRLEYRAVKIDVITTQDPFETGLAGLMIARLLGAKFHIQIHTDFMSPYFAQESVKNRIRVRLAKIILPHADAVRVVSERVKRSIEGIVKEGTPLAVLPIFSEKEYEMNATHNLKKKYPQFDKHILMASRLSLEKNIFLALSSMKEIVAKYPKVGLIIVGSGPEEAQLKNFVQKNNLGENVIFEGWSDNLAPYYASADVFLLTSNYEGYAMTVVEALSFECPVVMTDVGCAGEVLRHGKNGLVVPVGDAKALTSALLHIVTGGVVFKAPKPEFLNKEAYVKEYFSSVENSFKKG